MSERNLLMIPGPTQVDPIVMRAMMKTTESHMSESFGLLYRQVLDKLKKVFVAEGEAFAMAGSGTLAQEIALANMIRPRDKVLNLVTGYFSGRFVDITKCLRGVAHPLTVQWGKAIKPEDVRRELAKDQYRAVTCAHVETSTGVAIPIREIGEEVKAAGVRFVVDTVASLGGLDVRTDDWGIDANCTCSQKCLGVPPGLAMIGLSKEGLEEVEERKELVGSVYSDLKGWLDLTRNPTKVYYATQPVNLVYALDAALDLIIQEGLERRFHRHRIIAEACRSAMTAMGLKLVAEKGYAADTVTSVFYPEGIADAAFRGEVARNHVIIARGFGELEGKIFRVGHMGNVNANDIMATLAAIERGMKKAGHRFKYGDGLGVAQTVLDNLPS
jgi:alanine-glyoxylate transaminase/serine-glyoxylate transaminase/serine-pyruvate transaminase